MIDSLRQFFEGSLKPAFKGSDTHIAEHATRLATAALLVETARSDFEFDMSERDALDTILQRVYGLTKRETEKLMKIAEAEVDASTSLDQFTRLLDRNLGFEQKYHVLELLWEVAFVDGRIDKYEEYLIRKIADLLHVSHSHFIRAKLTQAERHKRHG
jgi:uncharacterized tellurite resistance protein B-like protein